MPIRYTTAVLFAGLVLWFGAYGSSAQTTEKLPSVAPPEVREFFRLEQELPECIIQNTSVFGSGDFQLLNAEDFQLVPFQRQWLAYGLVGHEWFVSLDRDDLEELNIEMSSDGNVYLIQMCARNIARNAENFAASVFSSKIKLSYDRENRHLHSSVSRLGSGLQLRRTVFFVVKTDGEVSTYTTFSSSAL